MIDRDELIKIAQDAASLGRWEEAHDIRLEAFGVTTGEPKERHDHLCGPTTRVLISQRSNVLFAGSR